MSIDYKNIIRIRKENRVLARGNFKELLADNEKDIIAYERFDDESSIVVIINNSFNGNKVTIETGEKCRYFQELITNEKIADNFGTVEISIGAKKGLILKKIY